MIIRQESNKDYNEVYNVVKEAFKEAEHRDGTEQDLVVALRNGEGYIPQLSLVAEIDGKIAGHIMFTEGRVGKDTVLVLAPLSVRPEFQKQGVGTALVKEGHRVAKELGYEYSLVLGSEVYYPSFGYEPAVKFGVELPEGMPSENFMAIKLQNNEKFISGAVAYAKEFGI